MANRAEPSVSKWLKGAWLELNLRALCSERSTPCCNDENCEKAEEDQPPKRIRSASISFLQKFAFEFGDKLAFTGFLGPPPDTRRYLILGRARPEMDQDVHPEKNCDDNEHDRNDSH
jgi:hypothetical protein